MSFPNKQLKTSISQGFSMQSHSSFYKLCAVSHETKSISTVLGNLRIVDCDFKIITLKQNCLHSVYSSGALRPWKYLQERSSSNVISITRDCKIHWYLLHATIDHHSLCQGQYIILQRKHSPYLLPNSFYARHLCQVLVLCQETSITNRLLAVSSFTLSYLTFIFLASIPIRAVALKQLDKEFSWEICFTKLGQVALNC